MRSIEKLADKVRILLPVSGLKEFVFFFTSGFLVSVPLTLFIDQFDENFLVDLPHFYSTLIPVVIVAPFLEEFAKAFPLFYRRDVTARSLFVLALLVGLGFGIYEFFAYVVMLGASVLPRLPGFFFHASSTSITSYGIATKRTVPFYLAAVLLHFSNNFAFFHLALDPYSPVGLWTIGSPIVVAVALSLSWKLYGRTSERNH